MNDTKDPNDPNGTKGRLSLKTGIRPELARSVDAGLVRQSFSHGRSKVVQVEIRKKRGGAVQTSAASPAGHPLPASSETTASPAENSGRVDLAKEAQVFTKNRTVTGRVSAVKKTSARHETGLTASELAIRQRVLADESLRREEERRQREIEAAAEAARQEEAAREEALRQETARQEAAAAATSAQNEPPEVSASGAGPVPGVLAGISEEPATAQNETGATLTSSRNFARSGNEKPGYTGLRSGLQGAGRAESGRPDSGRRENAGTYGKPGYGSSSQTRAPSGGTGRPVLRAEDRQAQDPQAASRGRAFRAAGFEAQPAPVEGDAARFRTAKFYEEDEGKAKRGAAASRKVSTAAAPKKSGEERRRSGKVDIRAALSGDEERVRSLASVRRQRERERRQAELEKLRSDQVKVIREVILPEAITVQELAARMAARAGEVVKSLMKLGVMVTVTQTIDADTAELVVQEFGHKVRRITEADIEIGLEGQQDSEAELRSRPPVVTVMGHVDHGKTSLLDALRKTDVVTGEAGGITQHIGAYQVVLSHGAKITFIDTPGHEAFTAMRSRGAKVTDIVVLVVAADDGVMPQTIEAIKHAQAAQVPIIVAINKTDKPGANPDRVRKELLQHSIVVEAMGGDTQDVEVSAKKAIGLEKLEEAVLLQAEILELRANPDRAAEGVVIESKLDRGRGPVATVLVQKGTLKQGDVIVAGTQWGRVRAMLDNRRQARKEALPSDPVEILGLSGVPGAGDNFVVVESETRAREVAEFRQRQSRERIHASIAAGRGTLDQMLARIRVGEQKEIAVLVKADVQGSAEAIEATVGTKGNDEVQVRTLLAGVGQITESDVQLAKASDAVVIGFNVRATAQAIRLARQEGVEIHYYSIIYDVADDIEKLVKGKMAPRTREKFLGYAEIKKVFHISKTGNVAGCLITDGIVRRGAGVRLLRDGVVIHTGDLSQLRRFKDDVKEVTKGYECGLSFAGFNDLKEGDLVECFETEQITE